MTLTSLPARLVPKPWGRCDLPEPYRSESDERIGEVIFDDPEGPAAALLLKLLFTSEKLSVQVHPDDAASQARGHLRGKDEAWFVLDAEPDARIAFGPKTPIARAALRAAALDGSIEDLLDWRPVEAGDALYSPAGTIHAIGPGLSLVEVQQNLDLTYRLYDYGRPRELHLDEAVAVARTEPAPAAAPLPRLSDGRRTLAHGAAFQVEQLNGPLTGGLSVAPGEALWLLPLSGEMRVAGVRLPPLSAWRLESNCAAVLDGDAELILAYPGGQSHLVWRQA